jgi:hypothetical protein
MIAMAGLKSDTAGGSIVVEVRLRTVHEIIRLI